MGGGPKIFSCPNCGGDLFASGGRIKNEDGYYWEYPGTVVCLICQTYFSMDNKDKTKIIRSGSC